VQILSRVVPLPLIRAGGEALLMPNANI